MFGKILEVALSIFKKAICIFDDIPFLLKGIGILTGLFTLIGAGYLIFCLQFYNSMKELAEAYKKKDEDDSHFVSIITSLLKVAFAMMGLVFTTGLLVLTIVGILAAAKTLLMIASALSAVIPLIMAVVAGIELMQSIDEWTYANTENVEAAKIDVIYNVMYFGLALIVTALATVTVILGPGIPTYILIGVIGVSVGLKLFQERQAIWDALCAIGNSIMITLNKFSDVVERKIEELVCWLIQEPVLEITSTSTRRLAEPLNISSSGESLINFKDSSETSSEKEFVTEPVTQVYQNDEICHDDECPAPVFSYRK